MTIINGVNQLEEDEGGDLPDRVISLMLAAERALQVGRTPHFGDDILCDLSDSERRQVIEFCDQLESVYVHLSPRVTKVGLPSTIAVGDAKELSNESSDLDVSLNWLSPLIGDGERFGRFEIIRTLGMGGHGVVFLARDPLLDRLVALKLPRPDVLVNPSIYKRFLAEGRAAAMLAHPNIVTVFESGEVGSICYLAQDYVPGPTLAEWLQSHPELVLPRIAARLLLQLTEAITLAHQRQILHRDIKPGNVLLAPLPSITSTDNLEHFQPRLADFGIAKLLQNQGSTRTGSVVGTPAYMSPEQAAGRLDAIDERSDIYSLGVVLYELLTHQRLYHGTNDLDTLQQVLHSIPPSPRAVVPNVPRDLDAICLKCLRREPRDRYRSAAELSEDLRRFLDDRPVAARPPSKAASLLKWCRRNPIVALLASTAMLATLAFLVVLLRYNYQLNQLLQTARELAAEKSERATSESRLRAESNRQLAHSLFEQNCSKCTADDAAPGLLWLVRSFQRSHELGARDLERAIRRQISGWKRFVPRMQMVFDHPQPVLQAEFDPAGKRVMSLCADGCVRVWNRDTGMLHCPPLKQRGDIKVAAFHPGGAIVATADTDGNVQLWDVQTGSPAGEPLFHADQVGTLAFSPDGKRLISGSRDQTARLWNAETWELIGGPLLHASPVTCASFSEDGTIVVTGTVGGLATLWNSATGDSLGVSCQHQGPVTVVKLSPDGKMLVTGAQDHTARIWNAESGELRGPPLHHGSSVILADFNADGRLVVTADNNHTARLWETASGKLVGQPMRHLGAVTSIAFNPYGSGLLTSSLDWKVRLWDVTTTQPIGSAINCQTGIRTAVFSADGMQILTGDDAGFARLWEIPTMISEIIQPSTKESFNVMAISPRGDVVLTASAGEANLWDAVSLRRLVGPANYVGHPKHATFSPDGTTIQMCFGFGSRSAQIWNAETLTLVGSPLVHEGEVMAGLFTPDGKKFLTAGFDRRVRLWDVDTQQQIEAPLEHPDAVCAMALSPDGKMLATGCEDGNVRRWNLDSMSLILPILPHDGAVWAIDFSADGNVLVTGSFDHTARFWDAQSGTPRGLPLSHGDVAVQGVHLSPDGETLLTVTGRKEVVLWNLAVGKPLGPPEAVHSDIRGVCLTPDGRHYLTGGRDSSPHAREIPEPIAGDVDGVVLWATRYTGMELDPYENVRPVDSRRWKLSQTQTPPSAP